MLAVVDEGVSAMLQLGMLPCRTSAFLFMLVGRGGYFLEYEMGRLRNEVPLGKRCDVT